ncbi:hypothetical protein CC2G_001972 [Coprinopsis cinerea AmutBmut pab1-1]|nr:hypothetical protein CC2G_001972 [Coprinopsis cinerea AmutBmut pab1-1]
MMRPSRSSGPHLRFRANLFNFSEWPRTGTRSTFHTLEARPESRASFIISISQVTTSELEIQQSLDSLDEDIGTLRLGALISAGTSMYTHALFQIFSELGFFLAVGGLRTPPYSNSNFALHIYGALDLVTTFSKFETRRSPDTHSLDELPARGRFYDYSPTARQPPCHPDPGDYKNLDIPLSRALSPRWAGLFLHGCGWDLGFF